MSSYLHKNSAILFFKTIKLSPTNQLLHFIYIIVNHTESKNFERIAREHKAFFLIVRSKEIIRNLKIQLIKVSGKVLSTLLVK